MALGVEAAGLVTAVWSMVTDWASGDEVMTHPLPLRDQGTWAPTLIAPSGSIARKPAGVSWEAAAVFPVPALTAAQVLDEALGVGPGDRLLVNGAGGVTGRLLVSLGSLRGAEVIATAGARSHALVAALGARYVIDYHEQDWPDRVLALTGGSGVAAAVNAAPGGAGDVIRAVRHGGRLTTITSDPPEQDRGITVSSVYVRPDAASWAGSRGSSRPDSSRSRSRRAASFLTLLMRLRQWSAGASAGRSRSRSRPRGTSV